MKTLIERVVMVLSTPYALYKHHRIFKQMRQDWEAGYRP